MLFESATLIPNNSLTVYLVFSIVIKTRMKVKRQNLELLSHKYYCFMDLIEHSKCLRTSSSLIFVTRMVLFSQIVNILIVDSS